MIESLSLLVGFCVLMVVASINYKLGRIARALENGKHVRAIERLAEIELPTLTTAVSECSQALENLVDPRPLLIVPNGNRSRLN